MSNISAIVAGVAFVALAATNVVVILEVSQPSRNGKTRTRLIAIHKAGGYLFVILLCIMAYSMSQRLVGVGITGHLPTHLVLHIVLVLVLVPLLFLKILIARRYKHSQSSLKALGIAIFVLSFALVSIPTLSELLRLANSGSLALWLDRPDCYSEPGRMCLGLQKKKTIASFHGVAYSGDFCAGIPIDRPRKCEGSNESST